MVFSSGLPLCSFLACLFALAGGIAARADVVVPPNTVRVPVATPVQAEAVRGFPVEIRLQGVTASTRLLQFILRQPPPAWAIGRASGAGWEGRCYRPLRG